MVGEIIITKESNAGRKITENERRQCVSEWFGITEYSKLVNLINICSLESVSRNIGYDNEINLLNSKAKPLYMENPSIDPQDEYFAKLGVLEIREALELVLQNTQEKTRECYRALFTAYCIDRSIDFEGLAPLLDSETLETYLKDGKKPKQHEIYLKYHPEAKKTSADAISSKMNKDFFQKLYLILK